MKAFDLLLGIGTFALVGAVLFGISLAILRPARAEAPEHFSWEKVSDEPPTFVLRLGYSTCVRVEADHGMVKGAPALSCAR